MIGHGGRPAHRAEIDGVHVFELRLPIVGHHGAGLRVVVTTRPVDMPELQIEAKAFGGRLQYPQTLGHDFLAEAVTRNRGDRLLLCHCGLLCGAGNQAGMLPSRPPARCTAGS